MKQLTLTPKRKRILSYLGLMEAVGGLAASFGTTSEMPVAGGILWAVGFGLPSWWWLRCERLDKQAREQHEKVKANYSLLSETDLALLAPLGEPATVDRKWSIIGTVSVVAVLLAGASMSQAGASTSKPATTSTTVTATTTVTETEQPTTAPAAVVEPTEPATDNQTATEAPATAETTSPTATRGDSDGYVRPGAYCSGGTGMSKNGVSMTCAPTAQGSPAGSHTRHKKSGRPGRKTEDARSDTADANNSED